jgi:hypothetical protein
VLKIDHQQPMEVDQKEGGVDLQEEVVLLLRSLKHSL